MHGQTVKTLLIRLSSWLKELQSKTKFSPKHQSKTHATSDAFEIKYP
jgi:hypothetical protein